MQLSCIVKQIDLKKRVLKSGKKHQSCFSNHCYIEQICKINQIGSRVFLLLLKELFWAHTFPEHSGSVTSTVYDVPSGIEGRQLN
jgi:hypothetical protein